MIFNASATHALRAMAQLAATPQAEATLARELAHEIQVPAHYLSKVLATLARAGVLTATRGARGGYRLARAPGEITLLEIVEPFEGKRLRPGCLLDPAAPCRDEAACAAHAAWSGVKETFLRFLEGTTLAELRGPPPAPPARRRTSSSRPSARASAAAR